MFERWAARHGSSHTWRAYRRDVLSFAEFMGIRWPEGAEQLLRASVADVQYWRDAMREQSKAPKTLNRRISSLSSFYKYLAGAAAEFRLPSNVPNPAHAQFIARKSSDPLEGTRALTATYARQLMARPPATTCSTTATAPFSRPISTLACAWLLPAACTYGTFTWMATRPLSLSMRKATATAPSAFISWLPNQFPNTSPRPHLRADRCSVTGVHLALRSSASSP